MRFSLSLPLAALVVATLLGSSAAAAAPARGAAVGLFGPYAVFRSGGDDARCVPLRQLSDDDCLGVAREPAAADTRPFGGELASAVARVRNDRLEAVAAPPAPELLVVFFGAESNGYSWQAYFNFLPTYRRLRAVYGDRFETLFLGLGDTAAQHRDFARTTRMPWLVATEPAATMPHLARLAPAERGGLAAITPAGVRLLASPARDRAEIRKFVDDLADLLFVLRPGHPGAAADRLRYFNLTRPSLHPTGDVAPLLVDAPLRDDVLRRKGVATIAATLAVGADGRVTSAAFAADDGVPPGLRDAVADGLRRAAVFSPALAEGRPVAARHEFRYAVPPEPPCSAADRAWVEGEAAVELPLLHWLVLRPVRVPEQSFGSVERVDENGVNILTPFEVSDERIAPTLQRNAFNSDWFEFAGAASVQPVAGAAQRVEGSDLVWQPVLAQDGFVELQTSAASCDFSIGYAWTEIEVATDTDAWLALGSDDGVKIWVNGDLVHSRWIRRNCRLDDEVVPLRFRAGKNQLLLKVQNMTADWNFIARLRRRG